MKNCVCLLVLFSLSFSLFAENPDASLSGIFNEDELKQEFPLWAKDLRRYEIILFGSLPFTFFLARMGVDTWRWSDNSWDTRYAPWPIRGADAIEMNDSEAGKTIAIAFGTSALIALTDFLIVKYKKQKTTEYKEKRKGSYVDIEIQPAPEEIDGQP